MDLSIILSLTQQDESGCLTDEQTEVQGGKLMNTEPHTQGPASQAGSPELPCLLPRRPQTDTLNGNGWGS